MTTQYQQAMITSPFLTYGDGQYHLNGHLPQPVTLDQWRTWLAHHGISPDDATVDGEWAIASFIDREQARAALKTAKTCPPLSYGIGHS